MEILDFVNIFPIVRSKDLSFYLKKAKGFDLNPLMEEKFHVFLLANKETSKVQRVLKGFASSYFDKLVYFPLSYKKALSELAYG